MKISEKRQNNGNTDANKLSHTYTHYLTSSLCCSHNYMYRHSICAPLCVCDSMVWRLFLPSPFSVAYTETVNRLPFAPFHLYSSYKRRVFVFVCEKYAKTLYESVCDCMIRTLFVAPLHYTHQSKVNRFEFPTTKNKLRFQSDLDNSQSGQTNCGDENSVSFENDRKHSSQSAPIEINSVSVGYPNWKFTSKFAFSLFRWWRFFFVVRWVDDAIVIVVVVLQICFRVLYIAWMRQWCRLLGIFFVYTQATGGNWGYFAGNIFKLWFCLSL